ncbi:MAG: DcaP family trimeric outer membrane transporter [Desulfobacteraceae bacterium]|jgi:hypothetical protein
MKRRIGWLTVGVLFCLTALFVPASVMAIEFQVPGTNTTLNVGGYVKLDVIYNDVSAGDDAQANIEYSPSEVPLDNTTAGEEDEVIFNARESRLWVKTSTPTDMGPLKTHLEFDFDTTDGNQLVSNSRHGRIRHAYGTLKGWLFGTTWSLFMHLDSLPEINDFGGPTGAMFVRQPQIRYTFALNDNSTLAIGLENPETYYDAASLSAGAFPAADDGVFPDIIVRWSMNPSWGNLSAAVMGRELVVDEFGVDDSAYAFAGQVGAVIRFTPSDSVRFQVSGGDALGRYSSLATHFDAVVSAAGDVDALQQIAGFVGYEHIWGGAMNWRSNLIVGASQADDPPELSTSNFTEKTFSVHANLFFDPVPNSRLGIEYIRGERETYSGLEGELNRIQFSAMFVF